MEIVVLFAVVVLVVLAVFLWLAVSRLGARMERQSQTFRDEMQGLRQETQTALTSQLGQVGQTFQQQLGDVRTALQKGLTDAGQLSSKAQENVGERLAEAAKLITNVSQQLGGLEEAGKDLRGSARTLEAVLSGVKTRGALGEVALDRMLADALPQDAYELQYRFRSGAMVDAGVKLGEKILPIDSKFPLEAYRRLMEAGTAEEQEQPRKEFARAVRKHASDISEKYILPGEGTLEVAFMFMASEGVYYELLRTEDSKGALDASCRELRVVPVSPNTLYAYLAIVLMGLRGLQVEENARMILNGLSGLQTELQAFGDTHSKLGTHLKNANQSYADATARLEKVERSLTALAQGATVEELEAEPAGKPSR
jgi:DNA recombination protein RmuC